MNYRKFLPCLVIFAISSLQGFSQSHKCATPEVWQNYALRHPEAVERRAQSERETRQWIAAHSQEEQTAAIITIPVVVHVVYNTGQQNISDAQIHSQISSLNEDYRLRNSDSILPNHPFWPYTADCQIEFCLASLDPNGNSTNGITRTNTATSVFQGNGMDDVKFTANGGIDNWDPTRYLNIWVCNLDPSLYGYATFPSDMATDPDYDGVVITHSAFGNQGTVQSPSDLGRTGTHEIGHWLNLNHIWGDAICGDDSVADTEPAHDANYGCPGFPYNANSNCGSGTNGEMYMNYMDYVDDNCMNMFTAGQKFRMRAALNGDRSGLLSSGACGGATHVASTVSQNTIHLVPNPSSGIVTVESLRFTGKGTIIVRNALGVEVQRHSGVASFPFTLDLSALPGDLYFVTVSNGKQLVTQKVIITH